MNRPTAAIIILSLFASVYCYCGKLVDEETSLQLTELAQNHHYKALKRNEPVWIVTGVMNVRKTDNTVERKPIYKMDVVFLKTTCLKKDVHQAMKENGISSLAKLAEEAVWRNMPCVHEGDFVTRHYKASGDPLNHIEESRDV